MGLNLGLGVGITKGGVIADQFAANVSVQMHFENNLNNVAPGASFGAPGTSGSLSYSSFPAKFGSFNLNTSAGGFIYWTPAGNVGMTNTVFTAEMWIYPNLGGSQALFTADRSGSTYPRIELVVNSNGSVTLYLSADGTTLTSISPSSTGLVTGSAWNAIALVRNGNNFYVYVNGNLVLNPSAAIPMTAGSAQLIGMDQYGLFLPFQPGIDELRITDGVARYTGANYTLATNPFTP